ncbi:RanBP2-type zinc finger protein [Acorus calamus]|uniref:RanBP2-type zinc finger protein n=1 Tax=Acorus calamus TaxID=4465 RepID=A0AAV9CRY2_ACOCL|nr:RanBP2-type zinc finger protein [Acorus calamus]
MSQVDNRNSSAAKRARTDGSRREDDWTCPSCGNVNFSFRTTCNMRNCTQPRPVDHNSKSTAKPLQGPPSYSPSAAYMNSGAPSSMYFGAPYGSSLFNGSSMPPYDFPFSGGSGFHYDYGSRLSVGSPYGPLHLSAPPPYSSGSMLGSGGMYGVPPMMDRYGLGFPMGQSTMGLRPGMFPDDNSQKKSAGMSPFAARMIHMPPNLIIQRVRNKRHQKAVGNVRSVTTSTIHSGPSATGRIVALINRLSHRSHLGWHPKRMIRFSECFEVG